MKVTTVEYRKLVSHGQYENTSIGATAVVDSDETPPEALSALQGRVDAELLRRVTSTQDAQDARSHLYDLQGQVAAKADDLRRMGAKYTEVKRILEKHGVEVEQTDVFDPPF